jgi:hypothetical protein
MKIVKTASGKTTVKMSKKEWTSIGKKAGWMKKAVWDDEKIDDTEEEEKEEVEEKIFPYKSRQKRHDQRSQDSARHWRQRFRNLKLKLFMENIGDDFATINYRELHYDYVLKPMGFITRKRLGQFPWIIPLSNLDEYTLSLLKEYNVSVDPQVLKIKNGEPIDQINSTGKIRFDEADTFNLTNFFDVMSAPMRGQSLLKKDMIKKALSDYVKSEDLDQLVKSLYQFKSDKVKLRSFIDNIYEELLDFDDYSDNLLSLIKGDKTEKDFYYYSDIRKKDAKVKALVRAALVRAKWISNNQEYITGLMQAVKALKSSSLF